MSLTWFSRGKPFINRLVGSTTLTTNTLSSNPGVTAKSLHSHPDDTKYQPVPAPQLGHQSAGGCSNTQAFSFNTSKASPSLKMKASEEITHHRQRYKATAKLLAGIALTCMEVNPKSLASASTASKSRTPHSGLRDRSD